MRLWNQVQAALHTQLSRAEFNSWIRRVTLQSLEGGVATIMAPNALVKQAVEARYLGTLRDLLALHTGQAVVVRVVLNPHAPAPAPAPVAPAADMPPEGEESRPAWISAERWAALPTMLRVTLAGATLAEGQVQGRDRFCRQLLAGRYAHDVSELVAAAAASQ